ncbi:hypothetical protein HX014_10000 [Myroides marinus]|uniref:hypothetical protein n=1 Tax=Myroides marinus TaxID=703342 RepID=UPI002579056C|nr:hypothetical protein [Myroides marinus]MDM1350935.1 hypothetical protein [Myroides marinus]MDM1358142.1 hypothetical protein [Myroides marinus]
MQKEENSWMFSELLTSLKKRGYLVKGADDAIMLDIYEYCLEENLRKQAENFYNDFEPKDIKDELILDFMAMERARRNNDFFRFTIAIYQQIENIINTLFKREIEPTWVIDCFRIVEGMSITYNTEKKKEYLSSTKINKDFITQEQMVLRSKKSLTINWYPNQKFNIVMYKFMFKATINKYNQVNLFIEFLNLFAELYICRNQVHKGSKEKSDFEESTLIKVNLNQSQYYFKFYYLLEQFVFKIKENINTKP